MSPRRIALVTGGAGAVGAAVCHRLAADDWQVVAVDVDPDAVTRFVAELPGDGHRGVGLDVADTVAVADAIATVETEVGPIEALINVAGWDRFLRFVETTPEFWDRVIAVNYRGTLNTVHAVLPHMIERQRGRIVSVASDAARVGSSLESVYAGAKGAVVSFSKSVAREVARYGITVNVVCPGPTDTPMIRGMADELGDGEKFVDALTRAIPMRRLATADDVAPAIVFLVSDGAGYITGQTLSVSGGLTMAGPTGVCTVDVDVMVGPTRWTDAADLARRVEQAGFSGMLFTETGQTPWMSIAAAASSAPSLMFSTGIAVAFPISPMVAAGIAWELADNTGGRFRLGLGSQVRAHVERRYGAAFDPPGPRLRDYVLAVKDTLAAFRGERPLAHDGPYYQLSLLPDVWRPPAHEYGDIKVDISAVGPWMTAMAGEVADGVHVHPLHSMHYLEHRLMPNLRTGAERAGRDPADIDLLIPVFIVPGDTVEECEFLARRARTQIAFYGSTKNYAFQFDDLGFEGTSARLNDLLKAGDGDGMAATITDEMLDVYAIVGPWDEIADRLIERYAGVASRIISYLTVEDIARNPARLGQWGEIARAVASRGR